MDQYSTKEKVFDAFISHEINRMDAIEVLIEQFNMHSKEAEALVEAWEN